MVVFLGREVAGGEGISRIFLLGDSTHLGLETPYPDINNLRARVFSPKPPSPDVHRLQMHRLFCFVQIKCHRYAQWQALTELDTGVFNGYSYKQVSSLASANPVVTSINSTGETHIVVRAYHASETQGNMCIDEGPSSVLMNLCVHRKQCWR